MYFDSFPEFINMGGHSLYVWLAYAAFLIVIIWNLITIKLRRRQMLDSVIRHFRREQGRRENAMAPVVGKDEEPLPYSEQDS